MAQAAAVILTWRLWGVRDTPPMLPVVAVPGFARPSFGVGWLLLATLCLALVDARVGSAAHVAVLAWAVLADQMRLQPEFCSLALLLVALAWPRAAVLGRAHLVTLWFWAGFHKLLSTGFTSGGAVFIGRGTGLGPGVASWATPAAEIALAALALAGVTFWRRGRWWAVALAGGIHGAILLALVRQDWNTAVWPWNLAIPVAAAWLLTRAASPEMESGRKGVWVDRVVWVVVALYPAGSYVGAVDAYPSHHLYSSSTHEGRVCRTIGAGAPPSCWNPFEVTWDALNVPLPPEPRLYRQWFASVCAPGDVLEVGPMRSRLVAVEGRGETVACRGGP